MAKYDELPIYKSAYDLLLNITDLTKNFPKDFKHSTGTMLRDEVMFIILLIFRANVNKQTRTKYTGEIIERIQVVSVLLRLSKDMKFISIRQFSTAVIFIDSISKQVTGWHKHSLVSAE
jgi:hypothetical protein